MTEPGKRDPYQRPNHTYPPLPPGIRVCDDPVAAGDYFFYRDGDLVVEGHPADVTGLLAGQGLRPGDFTMTPSEVVPGLQLITVETFRGDLDTVKAVRRLRDVEIRDNPGRDYRGGQERRPGRTDLPDTPPRVSFNHVLGVQSHTGWGAGVPPVPRPPLGPLPVGMNLPGTGVRVGTLDTGLEDQHWFGDRWSPANGRSRQDVAEDIRVTAQNELEYQVGHGTFIAGTILQHAPGAQVVVEKVPDVGGCATDWSVHELLPGLLDAERNPVDVLNLSFGGYTWNNQPMPSICGALDAYLDANPDVVIVACAGNDNTDRPLWPGASHRVIGVGALDLTGDRWPRSNYGSWVNAFTTGSDLSSTFVRWPPPFLRWPTPLLQRRRRPQPPLRYPRLTSVEPERFLGWARWAGTSFAAARVSGAIAAELKRDGRNPREVVFDLVTNAPMRFESGGVVNPATFVVV